MTCDFQIEAVGGGAYDVVLTETEHGLDFVLVGDDEATHPQATVQRCTYAIGVWLGESPFDLSVGFPWLQTVFGGPVEGVPMLLQEHLQRVEGVDDLDKPPELLYDPAERRLVISPLEIAGLPFALDFTQ